MDGKDYPWLLEEKKAINEFVLHLKKPYLGFCLGCQLLGEVTGGKVVKSKNPEIGRLNVKVSILFMILFLDVGKQMAMEI